MAMIVFIGFGLCLIAPLYGLVETCLRRFRSTRLARLLAEAQWEDEGSCSASSVSTLSSLKGVSHMPQMPASIRRAAHRSPTRHGQSLVADTTRTSGQ